MSAAAIIGIELVKLDPDPRAPYRMTVDLFEDGKMWRWQVTGMHMEQRERTVDELARYEKREVAERMDALDHEAAAKILPIMQELFEAQVRVKYGDEGAALLERSAS